MRIGIDLGGTKIEIIGLDGYNGNKLFRKRVSTPKNYKDTILTISKLIKDAEKTVGQQATIGIGGPGSVDNETGLLRNCNTVFMNGKNLPADLSRILNREIKYENDANCFTLSEAVDGSASTGTIVFGVIIGTGCGGGIVIDRKVIDGANKIAGEWGHNPLPYPNKEELKINPNCYCGRKSCVETWISGTGFEKDFLHVNGKKLSVKEIVEKMREGDAKCKKAFDKFIDRFAKSVSYVINILDPDVIVVGGGVSNIKEIYTEVPKIWNKYIFCNTDIKTKIVPAKHGDSSGVRGAAWLWR